MSKSTTKIAIATAYFDLLAEKPINKITVNDITEKCEINRQTFYYHFHDIIDLTEWVCETIGSKTLKDNKTYDTWQEGFLSIFTVIKKDQKIVENIYQFSPKGYIYNYLYKLTYGLIYDVLVEESKDMVVREEDMKFIVDFYKYSFVGVVIGWIENGMKEDPKAIVDRIDMIMSGSFEHALNNVRVDKCDK